MTEVSKEIQYVGPDGRLTYEGMALLRSLGAAPAPAWGDITGTLSDQTDLDAALSGKQATLVSGTNIKTVNGNSLLGSGDLAVTTPAADILNAIAGAALGDVGTYAWLSRSVANTAITAGTTYAGSALRYDGNRNPNSGGSVTHPATTGGTPSGTWMAMGTINNAGSTFTATLFLRVS